MKKSFGFMFLGFGLLFVVLASVYMSNFFESVLEGKITIGDYVSGAMISSFTVFVFVAVLAYAFFKKARLPKSYLVLRRINECVIWLFIAGVFVIICNFVSSFIDNVVIELFNHFRRDIMVNTLKRQIWVQNFLLMLCGAITGVLFRLFVNDLRDIQDMGTMKIIEDGKRQKLCPKCGKMFSEDASFCGSCGQTLGGEICPKDGGEGREGSIL